MIDLDEVAIALVRLGREIVRLEGTLADGSRRTIQGPAFAVRAEILWLREEYDAVSLERVQSPLTGTEVTGVVPGRN